MRHQKRTKLDKPLRAESMKRFYGECFDTLLPVKNMICVLFGRRAVFTPFGNDHAFAIIFSLKGSTAKPPTQTDIFGDIYEKFEIDAIADDRVVVQEVSFQYQQFLWRDRTIATKSTIVIDGHIGSFAAKKTKKIALQLLKIQDRGILPVLIAVKSGILGSIRTEITIQAQHFCIIKSTDKCPAKSGFTATARPCESDYLHENKE